MSKKPNVGKRTKMIPSGLSVALMCTGPAYFIAPEPEPWQGKGKKPKGRIK